MRPDRWGWEHWALVILLLPAWALRLSPASSIPLHPDEALYGYWGLLIGGGRDPWLSTVPIYKPPLLPYLMAGIQALCGRSEFAVRMAGIIPSMLTTPLTAALAWTLYRNRWVAIATAIGTALSPLAISLSASAFLDPLMVALGIAACVAAARHHPGWAGALVGLSFATKQTGLMWTPLVIFWSLQAGSEQVYKWASLQVSKCLGAQALIVGSIFAWDAARVAQGASSFWQTGVAGYGGLRLIWPHELWTRLGEWLRLARSLFASPIINGALLIGLPMITGRALTHHRRTGEGLSDLLLISFSLVYLLLHWLWAFPIWGRYLLPLVPTLSIILGRTIHHISSIIRHSPFAIHHSLFIIRHSLFAILTLTLLISHGSISDGRPAYNGIKDVTAFLSHLPEGSVVYHHWLGWHYHFYLFDAPVYLAYWSTPAWLARDVQVFGSREPRYITFPSWESSARVEQALSEVGYSLQPVLTAPYFEAPTSFTTYHIQPLPGQ